MGAMNTPTNPETKEIPESASGNPVYEQTRQDMPLWCCGRNCGRNSRITVFVLGIIGIFCSSMACLSPHYFHFVSLRNDTFFDPEKFQPEPYRYAVEANVGLFRYEILEVFEYPWPPLEQRELFDAMHDRELERLARMESSDQRPGSSSFDIFDRLLQKKFPDTFYDDDDSVATDDTGSENATSHQTDNMETLLTRVPGQSPTDIADIPIDEVPDVLPGSNAEERLPTSTPTPSPTDGNPNDDIDVEIGVVKPYPPGSKFDKPFKNGRAGAMWAPIMATIGLIFATIEFCCCIYKCSWLPTAIFLYTAFMLQLMTMFLFMSEDFCDYTQDCTLGSAGFASVIAVICYLICQMLVCMTPRPPPKHNLLKKPPVRRKKKKKKRPNEFEEDEKDSSHDRGFVDEPSYSTSSRFLDPYDDPDGYSSSRYNDDYDDDYNNDYGSGNMDDSGYGDTSGYGDSYDQPSSGYDDGYGQNGYDNGYDDGYDGNHNNDNDQRSHDESHQTSYDDPQQQRNHDAQTYDDHDGAEQREYDDDAQAYDGQKTTSQSRRSLGSVSRRNDEYNEAHDENHEERPPSTSSGKGTDVQDNDEEYEKPASSTSSKKSKKK
eukprot:CAMPEP_0197178984 /NCGR_PEP_ID=MMETSP1423-20130617/4084_1 /TAXON_ID=476441 /ORGANISM="Pseudo-nitzschia heimii, Strain UNC1101" /LENGTH=601 /DNA_ID=CAMNT_0042628821 /DNA_START=241 /DNA_END=2046 /DNA_ORIENTATION=-